MESVSSISMITPSEPTPISHPATAKPATALVVAHTHWDRAWYWPFERHRGRLCELWEHILAEFDRVPGYRYTTDGQVSMVEDYLELRPDRRPVIEKLAREGRLKLGPCYVLPDVYCTGGEAQIRNLLVGLELSHELGGRAGTLMTLHYADTFGIIPEAPLIAAGFGFHCFVFMRGHADETPDLVSMRRLESAHASSLPASTRMFCWKASDGSQIPVFRLRDGYANAAGLGAFHYPHQPRAKSLQKDIKELATITRRQFDKQGEPLLLMAGVDHAFPQTGLPEILQAAESHGEFHFAWAHLDDLGRAVELKAATATLPLYEGEFHGIGAASVLGGTVSTRVYLKQRNACLERLLTHSAEALAAGCAFLGHPEPAAAQLRSAWKQLLKDQQHDGICGCSVDAVHRAHEANMDRVAEAADSVRRRTFHQLYLHYGGNREGDNRPSFALFNPQLLTQHNLVRYTLDFEGLRNWGDLTLPERYQIVDESGAPVPFREVERFQSTEHPRLAVRLELSPAVAGGSFKRFYLDPRADWPLTPAPHPRQIENERLRVEWQPNGTINLLDKQTGRRWNSLGFFSNQSDIGDSYDFCDAPGEDETLLTQLRWEMISVNACQGLQALKARTELPLSSGWDETTQKPSTTAVPIPVEVTWLLAPHWKHVETEITFANTAKDHRLRWNLQLPERPTLTRAGLKFHEICRDPGTAPAATDKPRVHPEHPADHFIAAQSADHSGLALFSQFPCNYEYVGNDPHRLAVTLERSIGWLCRVETLSTRPNPNAGPHTATPDAQCLGRTFRMRYALRPFAPQEAEGLFLESALWRTPPAAGQYDATFPLPDRPANAPQTDNPPLWLAEGNVFVSAFKPPHRLGAEGVILRLLNPQDSEQTCTLIFRSPVTVTCMDLNESPVTTAGVMASTRDHRSWQITLRRHGLATLHLHPIRSR